MSTHHKYTEEQVCFLIDNSKMYTRKELTDLFNKKYKTNISVKSITNKCNSYKSYGKEERHLVGDEVIRSDGYVIVKISNDKDIPKHKRWELKHRVVWEKEHGIIPDDSILMFKDGNRLNCNIENLVLVKRQYLTIMARNNLFTDNDFLNLYGISVAKLILKISEMKKIKEVQ